jgi:hypothetical protein
MNVPVFRWYTAHPTRTGAVPIAADRRSGRRTAADDGRLTAALAGRPEDFAVACRAALEDLERRGQGIDAETAFRALAVALAELAGTADGSRLEALCQAPNCVGHRTRA